MFRIGPLEFILIVCVGAPILVAAIGAIYFVIRAATKAGIKEAAKEEPKKE